MGIPGGDVDFYTVNVCSYARDYKVVQHSRVYNADGLSKIVHVNVIEDDFRVVHARFPGAELIGIFKGMMLFTCVRRRDGPLSRRLRVQVGCQPPSQLVPYHRKPMFRSGSLEFSLRH